jgi:hypothetical protein
MKCMDCPLKYVGQTGRTFNTRYKEHKHDIRTNNSNTLYANHILNTGHSYGTITDTMEIMKTESKGRYLNTLERYYIYEISKDNLHMNDTNLIHIIPYSSHYTGIAQNNSTYIPYIPHSTTTTQTTTKTV